MSTKLRRRVIQQLKAKNKLPLNCNMYKDRELLRLLLKIEGEEEDW